MKQVIYSAILVQLIVGVVLLIVIPKMRRQVQEGSYANNYDFTKREILYSIPMDEKQFVESLRLKNIYDGLEYTLDETKCSITFSYEGYQFGQSYTYSVTALQDGENLLRLYNPDIRPLSVGGRFSIDINSFFIRKCGAKPLDYDNYYEIQQKEHKL